MLADTARVTNVRIIIIIITNTAISEMKGQGWKVIHTQ